MRNFRTYDLAVQFYRVVKSVELPGHLRSQLLRAASSIVLNLAEGYGKFSRADQRRYYQIAFGSVRECQSIFDLLDSELGSQKKLLDHIAASLFKLLRTGP
jgi:four helix bundle protein